MKKLSKGWLTEGLIDFEYKKYTLLAYLKEVKQHFVANKLYPDLGDLIFHYNNLIDLKNTQHQLETKLFSDLKKIDLKNLQLQYCKDVDKTAILEEINEIIAYSLPALKAQIETGTEIYDFIENQLNFDTIGLIPLYDKEGYLLVQFDGSDTVSIFKYEASVFVDSSEGFTQIKTTFLGRERKGIANSIQAIKFNLIRRFKELPNPATFLISSPFLFPERQTILPIAKRLLMREINLKN